MEKQSLLNLKYLLRQILIDLVSIPFVFCFFSIFLPIARIGGFCRRKKGTKFRSLWAPTPILTISTNSKAERLVGYESQSLVYQTYYLTDDFDYNLERFFRIPFFRMFVSWFVFLWAFVKYDVFHFFFDRGLLPAKAPRGINRLELPLLKMGGKKVIVSAYGGDVRYKSRCQTQGKYNCCIDCDQEFIACICSEGLAKSNINFINRYADITLSMGDMKEYTPGSRNDLFYWAIDLKGMEYVGARGENIFPIKIIHAPNHRQFKGTRYLVEAVDRLKKQGYEIELQLIEKIANREALQLYREADIIAEQFLIGWHGYLAVEGMALGKPVVCFIRKPNEDYPFGTDCPIVSADPDGLEETLLWLIQNPGVRMELGKKGRAYVEEVFSLESVGKRLDQLYQSIGGQN
jgi:glycosyltransferase involved in cell wall biosynthesis